MLISFDNNYNNKSLSVAIDIYVAVCWFSQKRVNQTQGKLISQHESYQYWQWNSFKYLGIFINS